MTNSNYCACRDFDTPAYSRGLRDGQSRLPRARSRLGITSTAAPLQAVTAKGWNGVSATAAQVKGAGVGVTARSRAVLDSAMAQ